MPYIKKTVKAGNTMEVLKYHTYRHQSKGRHRGKGNGFTPLAMQKNNRRYSENKLRWKINANFKEGDMLITLTYRKEDRPENISAAKKELAKFLRKARALYKKSGSELKFISVTEQGSKGAVHHHLIINSIGIGANTLVREWKHGHPGIKYLDNSGNYGRVAGYLIKELENAKSSGYSCSRNLIEPEIHTEIIKRSDTWTDKPKALKGYQITGEVETGVTATGYMYQHYTMRKVE